MFVALVPIHKTGADFSKVKGSQTGRREEKKKEKGKIKRERKRNGKGEKSPHQAQCMGKIKCGKFKKREMHIFKKKKLRFTLH
jgi:hypothetical protein